MSKFRKVDPRIWHDEKFLKLSMQERLTWMYLLTTDQATMVGLYRLSIEKMASDLGMTTPSVRRAIACFTERRMVRWDADERLIWLPRWVHYNPPAGINQAKSYYEAASEFLPHPFGTALRFIVMALMVTSPGYVSGCPLTKRQAIIIRDGVACAYCGTAFTDYDMVELDHIVPRSKGSLDKYEELVAACKDCNRKKGTRTIEEFGYPFVRALPYSIGDALHRLICDPTIRRAFRDLYHGLPPMFDGIEKVSDILDFAVRSNAVGSALTTRSNAVPTQEKRAGEESRRREQEKEECGERADGTSPPDPPVSGPGVLDPELKKILAECPNLSLVSNGESSEFWDQVLGACEPYPTADGRWLGAKLRQWNHWFVTHPARQSRKRGYLEARLMGWLTKDLEQIARRPG